jgi:hypothetical protein
LEGLIEIRVNQEPILLLVPLSCGLGRDYFIEEEGENALGADAVVDHIGPFPEILYLRVIVQLPLFGHSAVVFLTHEYQLCVRDFRLMAPFKGWVSQ